MTDLLAANITVPIDEIRAFCERWRIATFALFGSVVRHDFGPESDIDVLVEFLPDARHSLLDRVTMEDELAVIFGRPVDLVNRAGLRNPFRRRDILDAAQVVYERPAA